MRLIYYYKFLFQKNTTARHLKVTLFLLYTQFVLTSVSFSQVTITLRPDSSEGKDAYIHSLKPDENYGDHPDFMSAAWTVSGNSTQSKSLMEFDFSVIPEDVRILNARLSLYSYNSPLNGTHSTLSGPNICYLERITEPWKEYDVTWNNQPASTKSNRAILPASISSIQHYPDINVTLMVQDMVDNPAENYGFILALKYTLQYRRMVFASSDNQDTSLHPKLKITYVELSQIDSCVVLQPDYDQGKDAYIHTSHPDCNYGNHFDFMSAAWTVDGIFTRSKSLIDFDLSFLHEDINVIDARLYLYSYNSVSNGTHSTMSGSNESFLERVIEPWDEYVVTWNNQPSSTSGNRVLLPASVDSIQHYKYIDVTGLISDMLEYPEESHGFVLGLKNPVEYRRLLFSSSDNPDEELHPKLEICYDFITETKEPDEEDISFYPNPAFGIIYLESKSLYKKNFEVSIYDNHGREVRAVNLYGNKIAIDIKGLPGGIYYLKWVSCGSVRTEKLIKY